MNKLTGMLLGIVALALGACGTQTVTVVNPDNTTTEVMFYEGNDTMDDLFIINGVSYFGTFTKPDDLLGDLLFKTEAGVVIAECVGIAKDMSLDEPTAECYEWQVVLSTIDGIQSGATFIGQGHVTPMTEPFYMTGSLADTAATSTTTTSNPKAR